MDTLPWAHGGPPLTARIRSTPDDFVVDEILGFDADGDGEHCLVVVRKRDTNTAWLAGRLAQFAGVSPAAIGYAGLKDRHAVTTQSFTVQLAGRIEPDWNALPCPGVEVLSSTRHRRKLKRGALQGNAFRLVLRDVQGSKDDAEDCLRAIGEHGVPNYFGEQRFGFGGSNVERARALFAGQRVDRKTRGLLLSAARSQLFNAVLAHRVADGSWNHPLDGEIWSLNGSRSWFGPQPWDEELAGRLARGDIHPSGPLWGHGPLPSAADAAALEREVVQTDPALSAGLEKAGMSQDRRPLRLCPQDLRWEWLGPSALQLSFRLPAGSYATVVLRELAAWN